MDIANSRLNNQVITIEDAETEIRVAVKNAFFLDVSRDKLNAQIKKIIDKALSQIKIKDLKSATYRSLVNFYNRQVSGWQRLNTDRDLFIALLLLTSKTPPKTQMQTLQAVNILNSKGIKLYGVALQEYTDNYFKIKVEPIFNNLISQQPLDPDDIREQISQRNTLRNRAEMEVRYQSHEDNINDLKGKGVKLVIASSHADCSDRCRKWQDRVYSLDGTYGTTSDGRKYVPLEEATDIFYTTKAGKTYKNGLLGFNCRHFLIPYEKGYRFPKVSVAVERNEYEITEKQRYMEKQIRNWRTKAVYYKGVDKNAYKNAKAKVNDWYDKYMAFSKEHERAYYPARTKI